MAFQKGDKVEVVPELAGLETRKLIGRVLTVSNVNVHGNIVIAETGQAFQSRKFRLHVPKEHVIAKGDAIICVDAAGTIALRIGQVYVVDKVYASGAIKIEGNGTAFKASRFQYVAQEPVVAAPPPDEFPFEHKLWFPNVGDEVFIIKGSSYREHPDDKHYVKDGLARKVEYLVDHGDHYLVRVTINPDVYGNYEYFYPEDLVPVWKGKRKQESVGLQMPTGPVPPFVPAPTPPAPNSKLREELLKRTDANRGGICDFSWEFKDGRMEHHIGAPCHAALGRIGDEITALACCIPSDVKRFNGDKEHYKRYLDYLLNRSPWAIACITKDVNEAMELGIYMNIEVNRHIMAGACVAIRTAQEMNGRAKSFCHIVDNGHNEHTAWIMSCAYNFPNGGVTSNAWGGGHDVLDASVSMAHTIKFFQVGYHLEKLNGIPPIRTDSGFYYIAAAVADKVTAPLSIRGWMQANVTAVKTGSGFQVKTAITQESVFKAASLIDKLITGQ